jgi:hypothetical protein
MKKLLLASLLVLSFTANAGTIVKYETAGVDSFTVPADGYIDVFACSGTAGGGGGNTYAAGGGGGLQRVFARMPVEAGEVLGVVVGAPGVGGAKVVGSSAAANGTNGSPSYVYGLGANRISVSSGIATGGIGANGNVNGAGGSSYGSTGSNGQGGAGAQGFNCNAGGKGGNAAANGDNGNPGKIWIYY